MLKIPDYNIYGFHGRFFTYLEARIADEFFKMFIKKTPNIIITDEKFNELEAVKSFKEEYTSSYCRFSLPKYCIAITQELLKNFTDPKNIKIDDDKLTRLAKHYDSYAVDNEVKYYYLKKDDKCKILQGFYEELSYILENKILNFEKFGTLLFDLNNAFTNVYKSFENPHLFGKTELKDMLKEASYKQGKELVECFEKHFNILKSIAHSFILKVKSDPNLKMYLEDKQLLPHFQEFENNMIHNICGSLLLCAVSEGNINLVNKIFDYYDDHNKSHTNEINPININVKDPNSRNALHTAVIEGNVEMVRLLLAKGVDHKAQDNSGYTPLRYAETHMYGRKNTIGKKFTREDMNDIVTLLKEYEEKKLLESEQSSEQSKDFIMEDDSRDDLFATKTSDKAVGAADQTVSPCLGNLRNVSNIISNVNQNLSY